MKLLKMNVTATVLVCALGLIAVTEVRADPITRDVDIENIEKVRVQGKHIVELIQGSTEQLSYTADGDWIDEVVVEQRRGTLVLTVKERPGWNWGDNDREVFFELQLKSLNHLESQGASVVEMGGFELDDELKLELHGASNLHIERLEADDVEVAVHGAGHFIVGDLHADQFEMQMRGAGSAGIEGEGAVDELDIVVHGAGGFSAPKLIAEDADISVHGAGRATVNVENNLDVTVSGVGTVSYYGNPDVDQNIQGFGSIKAARE